MEAEVTYGAAESAGMATGILILEIAIIVLAVIAMWKLFTKAGQPGWASIIPFYNYAVMCDIAGKPMWWVLLMFIPFVNIVISILVVIGMVKNFGRGIGTILGLIFFPIIFLLILGFAKPNIIRSKAKAEP